MNSKQARSLICGVRNVLRRVVDARAAPQAKADTEELCAGASESVGPWTRKELPG